MTTTNPAPTGFGSIHGVPGLPSGFTTTFSGALVDVDGIKLHVVTGGSGPVVLLVGGWPQFWYQWRLVMPALSEHFTVLAVDPRGSGLSDKPESGYDSGTIACEILKLMSILGHERYSLIGHDIGMWTTYAMASDSPENIERLVLVDAIIPGASTSPPLLSDRRTSDFLWHFNFNRALEINHRLVEGREDVYFGHQFRTKAATPTTMSDEVIDTYVEMIRLPGALHATFENYRDIDLTMQQTTRRKRTPLTMPVLGIAGDALGGENMDAEVRTLANNVAKTVVIDNCGHFVPEEAPEAFLAAVIPFLLSEQASSKG